MALNDPTPETPLTRADVRASITPNVTIENPDTRRKWQNILNTVLFVMAAISLFFTIFPEALFGSDIPIRAVLFVNTVVTMGAAYYGLTVTKPNIPKF